MKELPLLTNAARAILNCCCTEYVQKYKDGMYITNELLYKKLVGNNQFPLSKADIDGGLLYLEELNLIRDTRKTESGNIKDFFLSHQGFYYFELEESIQKQNRMDTIFQTFILPFLVSIATTLITLSLT